MSYGIWKQQGRGWSSIEIDTPGNHSTPIDEWRHHPRLKTKIASLNSRARKIDFSLDLIYGDYYLQNWMVNQISRGRTLIDHPGDSMGEHVRIYSVTSRDALERALDKLEVNENDRQRIRKKYESKL